MSLAMEALAINYLTHGLLTAVNNVWAWIAFLTAAISFWKIKSSSTLLVSSSPHASTSTMPDQPELPANSTTDQTTTPSFTSSKRYTTFCTLDNRRSSKFSVYYPQDIDDDKQGVNFDSVRRINLQHDERSLMMGLISQEDERTMGSIRRQPNHCSRMGNGIEDENIRDGVVPLPGFNGDVVRLWNEITAY